MIVRGRYDLYRDLIGAELDPPGRLKGINVGTKGMTGYACGVLNVEDEATRQQRPTPNELRDIALRAVTNLREAHLPLGDPYRAEESGAGLLIP